MLFRSYWIENYLSRENISRPRLQGSNTCPVRHMLTIALQILDLHHQRQRFMKESLSAGNSTRKTAVRETYADTSTFASLAALNPMGKPPATNSNQTKTHNSHTLQNHKEISQSPKPPMPSQIPNVPLLLPKSGTSNLPTFRSQNNNIIWIHNDNNKVPVSIQKSCSFITSDYQWKALRDLIQLSPPENHSINLSLIT